MKSKPNLSILNISLTSGGAEKVISLLLKELVNDYNVTLVLLYDDIHFAIPKSVKTVIFCKETPNRFFLFKIIDAIGFCFKYNKLLRKQEITYAVSFLAFPNLLNGIAAIFNRKTKTFISERGFPSDNTTSKRSLNISKIFYPLLYNRCYKLFSNSVYINQDLAENFGIKIPMEVIYNPIELPIKSINPNSLDNKTDVLKLINVGTLNIRKNQAMILKALQLLGNGYQLTILGVGHLKNDLNDFITNAKMENQVFLKGRRKNVNDFLLRSDCFVLSSNTEGFPNALLEAMAIGLPCISTNCLSGPLELLHENKAVEINKGAFFKASYGILVNNNDHEGLAKALHYLKLHPEQRAQYSQLAMKRARDYELKNIYANFNKFISN